MPFADEMLVSTGFTSFSMPPTRTLAFASTRRTASVFAATRRAYAVNSRSAPPAASPSPRPIAAAPSRQATPQTTGRPDRLSVWPFAFILALGSGLFALTVKNREGVAPRPKSLSTEPIPKPKEGSALDSRKQGIARD